MRTYTWGLDLVSEHQSISSTPTTSYYVFDGHGSVRALTNAAGAITDTYDYDAFGILTHSTGITQNNYLFAGEQFDPDLNLYCNRERYLNTSTGRFWSMDDFEGDDDEPESLHKYAYAEDDPIDSVDPSGEQIDAIGALGVSQTLDRLPQLNPGSILTYATSSVDKVLLSGGAYHTWTKLIRRAEHDIFNADCACFLSAHGLDADSLWQALSFQVPYDGTKSKITLLNAGLYPNSLSLDQAEQILSLRETVKQQFSENQAIRAESQAHGDFRTDVYLRPGNFDEITIEHEALHNLTGESDTQLAAQLGGFVLSGARASQYISQALRANRCDKPKAKKKKKR